MPSGTCESQNLILALRSMLLLSMAMNENVTFPVQVQVVGWKVQAQSLRVRLYATARAAMGDGVLKEGHEMKIWLPANPQTHQGSSGKCQGHQDPHPLQ